MMKNLLCALSILFVAAAAGAQSVPKRRALLIGIDDYTASRIVGPPRPGRIDRGWPDLRGAANDVGILQEMLVHVYGFDRKDIVTLTNHQATGSAILGAIEQHLVKPAAKGDVIFYYYAGHGSQVPNEVSDELDHIDESTVPADSRLGADDIRDKELRPLFNRILDRGAHLTLLLDYCYSGSGFRGLPSGAQPRGIRKARPIRDPKSYGPRPDERGALVFASTQDGDKAWEVEGNDGLMHGAFTWAWIRAMRDASAGEPAQETFLRAQARLRAEVPFQAPVMLGSDDARLRPFLRVRIDRRGDRTVVGVERVDSDGTVVLQGGWANGLSEGTELNGTGTRLRVIKMLGLGRSTARVISGGAVDSGALLEVAAWAAPPGRPLRVWVPRATGDVGTLAQKLAAAGKARWLSDPLEGTPTHVLRPRGTAWELLAQDGGLTTFANDAAMLHAISRLRPDTRLFAQFPAPAALIDKIGIGQGIVSVNDPASADYILVGRYAANRIEYAWMRPLMKTEDQRASGLPQRSAWIEGSAPNLREGMLKLRRIHAWHVLEAPPDTRAPYHLGLQREKTKELVRNATVIGGETYSVVLRATDSRLLHSTKRYYYAFVIDSHGKSYLAFPATGSSENRFPIGETAPPEVRLGEPSSFIIAEPYGVDTYFLLSTEEPLPNPSILAWDGVRAASWTQPLTPLEELLLSATTGTRSASRAIVTTRWSIERVAIESTPVPSPRSRGEG